MDSICDDGVFNPAYQVFGGIPRVKLVDVVDSVPQETPAGLTAVVSESYHANSLDA